MYIPIAHAMTGMKIAKKSPVPEIEFCSDSSHPFSSDSSGHEGQPLHLEDNEGDIQSMLHVHSKNQTLDFYLTQRINKIFTSGEGGSRYT